MRTLIHNEKRRSRWRAFYHRNRDKCIARNKEWASKNRDKINARMREYSIDYLPKYREKNRERLREYKRKYEANRRKNNKEYLLLHTLRKQLNAVVRLRKTLKWASTKEIVGCDLGFFVKHIESKFRDGMSWENYGRTGWHIDHIRPCATFDLTDFDQQKECFHYSNLQPLWAKDNLRKPKK